MPKPEVTVRVQLNLTPELIEFVERAASRLGTKRAVHEAALRLLMTKEEGKAAAQ